MRAIVGGVLLTVADDPLFTTIKADKTGNHNQTEAFKDNVVLPYAGVKASELPAAQQAALLELIGLYVGIQDDGHAKVKMAEVKQHLADTHFAWVGSTAPDAVLPIFWPDAVISSGQVRP